MSQSRGSKSPSSLAFGVLPSGDRADISLARGESGGDSNAGFPIFPF